MSAQNDSNRGTTGTILVVDDYAPSLQLIARLLAKAGYKVAQSATATSTLQQLASGALPDLILLDVMLGAETSYSLCQKIKSTPKTQGIPILFLSGLSNAADRALATQAGGDDFIIKPFEPAELLTKVASLRQGPRLTRRQNRKGRWR